MFTLKDIHAAHRKVRSGADFPRYFDDLTALGVTGYDIYVSDGHAEYRGQDATLVEVPRYKKLDISAILDKEGFMGRLKLHQSGGTNYPTFCQDAASAGVDKWTLDMSDRTCTYFDRSGSIVTVEKL